MVNTPFLVDNIIPLLEIRIWLNVSFGLLVGFMSDLSTPISYRLVVDLRSDRLSSITTKETTSQVC